MTLPNKESRLRALKGPTSFRGSGAVRRMIVPSVEAAVQGRQEWVLPASAQAPEVVQVHGPDHPAAQIQLPY